MSQSRLHSFIESWANIGVGYTLNMGVNFAVFPLFGWHISLRQNLLIGVIYTAVSLARSYSLRRLFNRWHLPENKAMSDPLDTRPRWMRWLGLYPDSIPSPRDSCNYQGFEFGANYPDSVCVEGYLWDADSGYSQDDGWVYTSGGDIPCPGCNERTWLAWAKEQWFSDAYDRASRGKSVYQRANRYRLAAWIQQTKALLTYWWDERPRLGK